MAVMEHTYQQATVKVKVTPTEVTLTYSTGQVEKYPRQDWKDAIESRRINQRFPAFYQPSTFLEHLAGYWLTCRLHESENGIPLTNVFGPNFCSNTKTYR